MKLLENNNWLDSARRILSPNRDERPDPEDICLLVIHGISLPPGEYGGGNVEKLFLNTLVADEHPYYAKIADKQVSAHLFINRHGDITQFVPFKQRAWHAGQSEFAGRDRCNDFSIGIELEGCDDQPYTTVQYEQLAELTGALQKHWPVLNKQRIVGHSQIAPGRKTDPGPAFDRDNYYNLLEEQAK